MNELDLHEEVSGFKQLFMTLEKLLEYRIKLRMADDQMAVDLCQFYGTWSACRIRRCLGPGFDFPIELDREENENPPSPRGLLPGYEIVQKAARDLLLAITAEDKHAVFEALKQMGVLSFCPTPEEVFSKMELLTSRVSGMAQQVFWVELSLFAASVLDYQARAFQPSSRELYNICVVEGLIALNDERIDEAIQCLDRSAEVCQTDVDSSIQCSLLAPNLDLAERLLELGERIAVLRYLTECHNVWQRCRRQIEEWIHLIESGEKPDFQTLEMPENANQPSYRLNVQWMRACSLEMQLSPVKPKTPMSPAQVLAERERRKAEYQPRMSAHIKKKLEYLEKDMAISPDQLPPNQADPS